MDVQRVPDRRAAPDDRLDVWDFVAHLPSPQKAVAEGLMRG